MITVGELMRTAVVCLLDVRLLDTFPVKTSAVEKQIFYFLPEPIL